MADVTLIAGLAFGDEGKGSIVDYLTRINESSLTIRYNGGSQAGHHVKLADGRSHVFSQWGSGTFAGAKTFLSRFMMVNPIFAFSEAKHLEQVGVRKPLALLTVEEDALVTTPFHVASNRLRELRRAENGGVHGSCGMGIGETMVDSIARYDDVITAATLRDSALLRTRLTRCRERKLAEAQASDLLRCLTRTDYAAVSREAELLLDPTVVDRALEAYAAFASGIKIVDRRWLARKIKRVKHVIFEGAQGVLLDQTLGFHPHTTWSDCTFNNALELLEDFDVTTRQLGVLRTYATRHGAGPLPTENLDFDVLAKDDHNTTNAWQHKFRSGAFDMVLAKTAVSLLGFGQVDGLVFTHVDKMRDMMPVCYGYDWEPGLQMRILSPKSPCDLRSQEELGRRLTQIKPLYEQVRVDNEERRLGLLNTISENCCTKLALTSHGPTAEDKIWQWPMKGRHAWSHR
jgi:adenylosuccinate synthase